MAFTINTRIYTVDSVASQNVTYRDPAATALLPSNLRLLRADPKPTANFNGVSKTEAKFSKKVMIGAASWPLILRADSSVPAGVSDVDLDLIIADFRSLVASSAFVELVKGGTIYRGA